MLASRGRDAQPTYGADHLYELELECGEVGLRGAVHVHEPRLGDVGVRVAQIVNTSSTAARTRGRYIADVTANFAPVARNLLEAGGELCFRALRQQAVGPEQRQHDDRARSKRSGTNELADAVQHKRIEHAAAQPAQRKSHPELREVHGEVVRREVVARDVDDLEASPAAEVEQKTVDVTVFEAVLTRADRLDGCCGLKIGHFWLVACGCLDRKWRVQDDESNMRTTKATR